MKKKIEFICIDCGKVCLVHPDKVKCAKQDYICDECNDLYTGDSYGYDDDDYYNTKDK